MARVTKSLATATLWHSLAYAAGKATKDGGPGDRSSLVDGMALAVELQVAGQVEKVQVNESVAGKLTVGHASVTTRWESVSTLDLIAWLLARHGEEDAVRSIDLLTGHYQDHGQLPDVSPASQAAAKGLVEALRAKKSAPTRGAVKFAAAA